MWIINRKKYKINRKIICKLKNKLKSKVIWHILMHRQAILNKAKVMKKYKYMEILFNYDLKNKMILFYFIFILFY